MPVAWPPDSAWVRRPRATASQIGESGRIHTGLSWIAAEAGGMSEVNSAIHITPTFGRRRDKLNEEELEQSRKGKPRPTKLLSHWTLRQEAQAGDAAVRLLRRPTRVSRREGKILLIEVPYQREYVWDDSKASRLIESLLLNVPIPVCYFAENEDGSWEVIDGLQRVHSMVLTWRENSYCEDFLSSPN